LFIFSFEQRVKCAATANGRIAKTSRKNRNAKSKFENAMGLTGLEPVTCFKIYHGKQARVQWLVH